MKKEYQQNIQKIINTTIKEQLSIYNFFEDGGNIDTDNGKEISNNGCEAIDNSIFILQISTWENWLNNYFSIKHNMEKYAPNMVNTAITNYLKANPSPFISENTEHFSKNTEVFFFEEVFKSAIEEDERILDVLKDTFHNHFNQEKFTSTYSLLNLYKVETPFIREKLNFKIEEEILKSPENIFIALKTKEHLIYRKNNEYSKIYFLENDEKFLTLLENIEGLKLDDEAEKKYLSSLKDKDKSKVFNFFNMIYKNQFNINHIDKYLDFIVKAEFVPNKTELQAIKNQIPRGQEKTYEPTISLLLEKTKILNHMSKVQKKEQTKTTEDSDIVFKI